MKSLNEVKEELKEEFRMKIKKETSAVTAEAKSKETLNTFLQVPYYTPSDGIDTSKLSQEEKNKLVGQYKLSGYGETPVSISQIKTRKAFLADQFTSDDYSYDANGYHGWTYTWVYLALAIAAFTWAHPLLAIPLAWKVGHNWSQYMGGRIWGKQDMKGKVMYATK